MTDDVTVKFGSETRGATAGVDEVKSKIGDLPGSANLATAALGAIGAAIVAAFSVKEIIEFSAEMGKLAEDIERVAQTTGMTTDAVQDFQFAVRMTGGDAGSAAVMIERLERNMLQAASGTGNAGKAFDALGISVTNADGSIRPINEVLGDIADRFSLAEDGATKTYYAMELMGRGGAALIPTLNKGRDGFAELNAELERSSSKLTPEQVKAYADLDDKIDLLDESYQGLKVTINSELTPSFTTMVEGLTSITRAVTTGILELNTWNQAWKDWGNGPVAKFFGEGKYREAKPLPSGAVVSTEMPEGAFGIKDWGESFGPPGKKGALPKPKNEEAERLAKERAKEEARLNEEAMRVYVATIETKQEADRDNYEVVIGLEQQKLDRLKEFYGEDSVQYQTAMRGKMRMEREHSQHFAQQFISPIAQGFSGMVQGILMGTQTWQEAMSNMFTNILAKFVEMIAIMIAEWLVFQVITGGSGGGGGGGFGIVGNALMSSFDVGSWSVPRDMLAVVHKGEKIIPSSHAWAQREGGAGGGGGAQYNVTVNAMDARSVANLLQDNSGVITGIVSRATRDFSPNVPAWKG